MNFYEQQKQQIKDAIASFPADFGLRAFPGERFVILESACYVSGGIVFLYTGIKTSDGYRAFCKGTIGELKSQITE
jgi:hypothetical protein